MLSPPVNRSLHRGFNPQILSITVAQVRTATHTKINSLTCNLNLSGHITARKPKMFGTEGVQTTQWHLSASPIVSNCVIHHKLQRLPSVVSIINRSRHKNIFRCVNPTMTSRDAVTLPSGNVFLVVNHINGCGVGLCQLFFSSNRCLSGEVKGHGEGHINLAKEEVTSGKGDCSTCDCGIQYSHFPVCVCVCAYLHSLHLLSIHTCVTSARNLWMADKCCQNKHLQSCVLSTCFLFCTFLFLFFLFFLCFWKTEVIALPSSVL